MMIAHYTHRLPADFDMGSIRARVIQRGPLWDTVPELCFKAFLLREQGQHGAIANSYSSLYLWRQDEAFLDFVIGGRFESVTDSFGRPAIETSVALDARRGAAGEARFATLEEWRIPADADLTAALAREIERNRDVAGRPGTVASAVGVDARRWTVTRVVLSDIEPDSGESATRYQVLHLARPLLGTLPPKGVLP